MEKRCGVVEDLLPLYVDGVCSDESRNVVDEHIMKCKKCEALLEDLKMVNIGDVCDFNDEIEKGDEILKDVSLRISRNAIYTSAGIVAIILYWLIYTWQERLSMLGDYRYFSYAFHELYAVGSLLVPILTIGWLGILLWKTKKRNAWRKNLGVLLILLVLSIGQLGFWQIQSQRMTVSCLATVEEVVDEYHVRIKFGEEEVLLTVEPMVATLLKTDGTVYFLGYETYQGNPDEGKLFEVWSSDIE